MAHLRDAKDLIRNPFAWPGGYPRYAVMDDGGCLCVTCVKAEFRQIVSSHIRDIRDGWSIAGADINWESALTCDHCGKDIESAYPVVED